MDIWLEWSVMVAYPRNETLAHQQAFLHQLTIPFSTLTTIPAWREKSHDNLALIIIHYLIMPFSQVDWTLTVNMQQLSFCEHFSPWCNFVLCCGKKKAVQVKTWSLLPRFEIAKLNRNGSLSNGSSIILGIQAFGEHKCHNFVINNVCTVSTISLH